MIRIPLSRNQQAILGARIQEGQQLRRQLAESEQRAKELIVVIAEATGKELPEGWSAAFDDGHLVITAPGAAARNEPASEED